MTKKAKVLMQTLQKASDARTSTGNNNLVAVPKLKREGVWTPNKLGKDALSDDNDTKNTTEEVHQGVKESLKSLQTLPGDRNLNLLLSCGVETSILALIQRGDKTVSQLLLTDDMSGAFTHEFRGILTSVLGLLQKCEHESMARTILGVRGRGNHNMRARGDFLSSPCTWIKILIKASLMRPSCMLEIAENIGPLVRCMCDDMQRVFFKSNQHWKEAILSFVELIHNMINDAGDDQETVHCIVQKDEIVESLLRHDGLLRSVIQWQFWGKKRPDIEQELKGNEGAIIQIADWGRLITKSLISSASTPTALVVTIGSIPVISKAYDPNCSTSYVLGSLQILTKEWGWCQEADYCTILKRLILDADCVDKDVIREIIWFGLLGFDYDDIQIAEFVATLSNGIIQSDTRVAFAIRSGLIEMCLDFIERFVGSFDSEDESLFNNIVSIFDIVHEVSLHQKTAKAIRSKKERIDELVCLVRNTVISDNTICKKLLDMLRSTLNQSGSYCCRCNKAMSKTEVMQCNGCSCMVYCSRTCQKEDWMNGHKLTCNKTFNINQLCHFQGRVCPDTLPKSEKAVQKMEELEKNVTMIQLKLFLDNTETILVQAKRLGIPLHDCVVLFDLRDCPVTVIVEDVNDTEKYMVTLLSHQASLRETTTKLAEHAKDTVSSKVALEVGEAQNLRDEQLKAAQQKRDEDRDAAKAKYEQAVAEADLILKSSQSKINSTFDDFKAKALGEEAVLLEDIKAAKIKLEEELVGFNSSRSEENITCVYISNMYFSADDTSCLNTQRFFPHEWLKKGSK